MSLAEEYTDEPTGMRLTVERDYPYYQDHPRITVYPPEGHTLEIEAASDAIRRLLRVAGYDENLHEWVKS